jgi:hypothetical protein
MEYVPHLVERLQQHFTTHAAAAALKYQVGVGESLCMSI